MTEEIVLERQIRQGTLVEKYIILGEPGIHYRKLPTIDKATVRATRKALRAGAIRAYRLRRIARERQRPTRRAVCGP